MRHPTYNDCRHRTPPVRPVCISRLGGRATEQRCWLMSFLLRAFIAVAFGLLLIFLECRVCPVSREPVLYWSLPLFHKIFPPLASGPSPQACLCSLVLNSVLLTGGIFWLLSGRGTVK